MEVEIMSREGEANEEADTQIVTADDDRPAALSLHTSMDSLSLTNSSIQRANELQFNNLHLSDAPENFCGNTEVHRQLVYQKNTCQKPTNSELTDMNQSRTAVSDTVKYPCNLTSHVQHDEISTNEVLQNGLGLILNCQASLSSNVQTLHDWQSSKNCIKSRLLYLYNTGVMSDISFIVGGKDSLMGSMHQQMCEAERFSAHKFVLSMSSAVFDAMFNGKMAHKEEDAIRIPDVEPAAFRDFLRFLYTDEINIESDGVMAILYTAKKYGVPTLERKCVEYLKDNINSDNVFMLLTQARLFDEPALADLCLESIDKNTCEALSSDAFIELDLDTLCLVLSRDSLGVREGTLFSAATKWAEHACIRQGLQPTPSNQRQVLGNAVYLIRYPLMTVEEFALQVAQTKILTDAELVELFLYFTINPKPATTFSDRPRCCLTGKEQVVSRFCQVDHRWGYSGTSDRIKFLVTKKIFVAGFGVYGSINGPAEYCSTIEILSADTQRVLASNDVTFCCDGSSSTYRVMFKEPIEIQPCIHYIAAVTMKGPDSYYGSKGLRKVTHESLTTGKVSFQFSYAAGNNNGTSVEDGQIPEIMFYT